jgi:hypothetical protein
VVKDRASGLVMSYTDVVEAGDLEAMIEARRENCAG